jgi:histidinol dehydrogenase
MSKIDIFNINKSQHLATILRNMRQQIYQSGWDNWIKMAEEAFDDIKNNGVNAIIKHNKKRLKSEKLKIDKVETENLIKNPANKDAYNNLKKFYELNLNLAEHHLKVLKDIEKIEFNVMNGLNIKYKLAHVERIGIYISPQYPSTLTHLLALARTAEINPKNIVVVTYPLNKELPTNAIISAHIAGINEIFLISGRYAIGALTMGIERVIEPVDMIMGPGGPQVDAAKRYAQMKHGIRIDLPAGPTETAIVASPSVFSSKHLLNSLILEALSQLEHGIYSQCFIVTTKYNDTNKITAKLESLFKIKLDNLGFKTDKINEFLKQIKIIILDDINELINSLDIIAPEYIIIISDDDEYAKLIIKNAHHVGTITVNVPSAIVDYSPETCLSPTWGFARSYSKFNINNLFKIVPIIMKSSSVYEKREDFHKLVSTMVNMEGFELHKASIINFLKD